MALCPCFVVPRSVGGARGEAAPEQSGTVPSLAGPEAAQDTAVPFVCQGVLLAHVALGVDPNAEMCFCGAAVWPVFLPCAGEGRVAPSPVQPSAALAVGAREVVGECPALWFAKGSVQGLCVLAGVRASCECSGVR